MEFTVLTSPGAEGLKAIWGILEVEQKGHSSGGQGKGRQWNQLVGTFQSRMLERHLRRVKCYFIVGGAGL